QRPVCAVRGVAGVFGNLARPARLVGRDRLFCLELLEEHVVEAEDDVADGVVLFRDDAVGEVGAAEADDLDLDARLCGLLGDPLTAAVTVRVRVDDQRVVGAFAAAFSTGRVSATRAA